MSSDFNISEQCYYSIANFDLVNISEANLAWNMFIVNMTGLLDFTGQFGLLIKEDAMKLDDLLSMKTKFIVINLMVTAILLI